MIDRKLWHGDMLRLSAGNSFYGFDQIVAHRESWAMVMQDSEPGDLLVEIDGGYIVKRADLHELNEREGKMMRLAGQLSIPEALNGIDREERIKMAAELSELIDAR